MAPARCRRPRHAGARQAALGAPGRRRHRELRPRTAEHLFSVLGQLKGGAMKLGQALSIFEAALPEHLAAPYRQALTKLQNAAPTAAGGQRPRGARAADGRRLAATVRSTSTTPPPRPRASGRSTGRCGRTAARSPSRSSTPGQATRCRTDLRHLSRMAPMFKVLQPNFDVKKIIVELRERLLEELDYELEAATQRQFAEALPRRSADRGARRGRRQRRGAGDRMDRGAAAVRTSSPNGTEDERNAAGPGWPHCTSPRPSAPGCSMPIRTRGTSRSVRTARLVVYDFGAAARMPDGHADADRAC